MAPARRCRRYQRFHLSRRGMGMERAYRGGLRRYRPMETRAQDSARRDCGPKDLQPRAGAPRVEGRP